VLVDSMRPTHAALHASGAHAPHAGAMLPHEPARCPNAAAAAAKHPAATHAATELVIRWGQAQRVLRPILFVRNKLVTTSWVLGWTPQGQQRNACQIRAAAVAALRRAGWRRDLGCVSLKQ
jgi:hypothetical protein